MEITAAIQVFSHTVALYVIATRNFLGRLTGLIAAGLVALAGMAGYLSYRFFERLHAPSAATVDMSSWGQFGDFMGGLLNPALGFLTVAGLFVTLLHQRKAMEENNRHATLNARLTVLTTMIDVANSEIQANPGQDGAQAAARAAWIAKKRVYMGELEHAYRSVKRFELADLFDDHSRPAEGPTLPQA
ncbi:hypothetical protein [Variovorax sp. LjRoot130]|uniref:hypothetical protein n=1 Tax=Variovorax sp. LjRoot130 TaxID=3342261 RepID=UPI003F510C0D